MDKKSKFLTLNFLLSLALGIGMILAWNNPIQNPNADHISRRTLGMLTIEEKELHKKEQTLLKLNKTYKQLEKELKVEHNILSDDETKLIKKLRTFLGEYNLAGEGIVIRIESTDENNNIAFEFDTNKILLKIINFAKNKGAEAFAINNQLISNNTGIVLAGNHINVNDIPITPPYEIKILGNEKKLYRYFTEESVLMLILKQNTNINIHIEKSKKISVPKIKAYSRLEYIRESK